MQLFKLLASLDWMLHSCALLLTVRSQSVPPYLPFLLPTLLHHSLIISSPTLSPPPYVRWERATKVDINRVVAELVAGKYAVTGKHASYWFESRVPVEGRFVCLSSLLSLTATAFLCYLVTSDSGSSAVNTWEKFSNSCRDCIPPPFISTLFAV